MNIVLIITTVTFCIGLTQALNNEKVNDGASTSRHAELDQCRHCELQGYAGRFVLLMTAQDVTGLSMTEMMNNHYPELEAFYNEIHAIIEAAEFGHNSIGLDLEVSAQRLRYFRTTVNILLSQIVQKACESHYRLKFFYGFDHQNGYTNIHHTVSCNPGECVCSNNARERSILSAPLRLPAPRRSENLRPDIHSSNVNVGELSAHHIIPIQLITRFFNAWLADDPTTPPGNNFNGCVQTLFGRIKRSMQKLLLVSMRQSQVFSDHPHEPGQGDSFFADGTFRISNIENAITWLSGNIFIGPNERGPYDPTFQRTEERQLTAFDYSAGPIVTKLRLQELEDLFHRMLNFIQPSTDSNPFLRLMHGFDIFMDMTLTINIAPVTPFDINQWERLQPTVDDLRFIRPELFRFLRSREFWSIKKDPTNQRPERSANYNHYYDLNSVDDFKKKDRMTEVELKQRWSEFVVDMIVAHLKSRSNGLSLASSCNFTRLYDDYIFRDTELVNGDCSSCLRFDEYLYLKISGIKGWYECNHNDESRPTRGWCSKWKRILTRLESKVDFIDLKAPKLHGTGLQKQKGYLKDMQTMMYLLLSLPIKAKKDESYRLVKETLQKDIFEMFKNSYSPQYIGDYYGYIFPNELLTLNF